MSDSIILRIYSGFDAELNSIQQEINNNLDREILIFTLELSWHITNLFNKNDYKNITYHVPGILNYSLKNAKVKPYLYWLENTRDFYTRNNEIINELIPYKHKEYNFEALLGVTNQRNHRTFLLNLIREYNLEKSNIICAFDENNTNKNMGDHVRDGNYIVEPGTLQNVYGMTATVQPVKFRGNHIRLSQILPVSVYNQTAYSVVSESYPNNEYSFYTEKTAKPIIGKRLFLIFAGQYHLRNLRSLGFKTFDNIIDESFDEIHNDEERWTKQFEQLLWLITQDQQSILESAKPIIEHNHQLIMNYDFGHWFPDWTLTA